jgi:hypothetical protein
VHEGFLDSLYARFPAHQKRVDHVGENDCFLEGKYGKSILYFYDNIVALNSNHGSKISSKTRLYSEKTGGYSRSNILSSHAAQ